MAFINLPCRKYKKIKNNDNNLKQNIYFSKNLRKPKKKYFNKFKIWKK